MISLHDTEKLHKVLIENFGGSSGIRDFGGLSSALDRPFQTFASRELYPGTLEKAAALIESILINHPFVDGNKRSGYALTRLFLLSNKIDFTAAEELKYKFVIDIAAGKIRFEEILTWLQKHTAEFN